jgi:hypothetical protein
MTSGNVFLEWCSVVEKDEHTKTESQHSIECTAYVEGVDEGVSVEVTFARQIASNPPPKLYCRPENSTAGQLVRITLKYIRNHPEDAHQPTVVLIVEALREAFPCPVNYQGKKP